MSKKTKSNASARSDRGFAGAPQTGEISWRRYPHLDAAIETNNPDVVASMERTRMELDRISGIGMAGDRERARTALAAYERVLELYRYLADLRDHAHSPISNMGAGTAITG